MTNKSPGAWSDDRRPTEGGFTLVELLVVLTIIALLAALLIPALSHAKTKAKSIKCLNNARQLDLGVAQFVSDFHVYPLYMNPKFVEGGYMEHHTTWVSALGKEVFTEGKSNPTNRWFQKGIWDCPGASRPNSFPKQEGYLDYGYNAYGMGAASQPLGIGARIGPTGEGQKAWEPVPEMAVTAPSDTIALGDGFVGGNGVIRDGLSLLGRVPQGQEYLASTTRSWARHGGKANVMFCDGHGASVGLDLLFRNTSDTALVLWNRDHQAHHEMLTQPNAPKVAWVIGR
jgi:prepilin-type N-terminal cleavage/methylation domain-containing protein/prepilin-type processing-associated H-X9-DG protein